MKQRFAMTGIAGYIAPRHLKALKDNNCELLAVLDPHDSVGILDQYFPDADYFHDFERFERHLERLKFKDEGIDYLSICSPNHLHDAHIRLALRLGANAICEKPLVLNPWNLDLLEEMESHYGKKIFTILQLRTHSTLIDFKENLKRDEGKKNVELTYITSRGNWYRFSWKGDNSKSGGVTTNIGIHLFDLLLWLFGGVEKSEVYLSTDITASGFLELKNANVKWFLSIDGKYLPENVKKQDRKTFRSITVDDNELEFSEGFTELHTKVYKATLAGKGFTISDARPSIELAYNIRNSRVVGGKENKHKLLR
ncbi:MAG: Gfo/Idh/MocA family oxidoreductase [Melioribacteraceae bacterium]|nr:Gfo/Idh/MocA family oxidoreductase [Melioribacteraceae bacterium]